MELKRNTRSSTNQTRQSLNRTFYGIETVCEELPTAAISVLIVPFMELKLYIRIKSITHHGS